MTRREIFRSPRSSTRPGLAEATVLALWLAAMPASGQGTQDLAAAYGGSSEASGRSADPQAPPADSEDYSVHAQATFVTQYHPSFASTVRGPDSLDPGNRGDETFDATLFAGVRLWTGGAFYADAEVDQGFGLSNTLGVAGFTSAEAYKVGAAIPYVRLPRAFFRQTIGLGGGVRTIEPDANQLGGFETADNITLTFGKFSVTDIFDTNSYAHDPRGDFLNWTIVDAGAFDYAADAWGYTYGGTAEWTQDWWTLRAGIFDLSRVPNSKFLDRGFGQFEAVAEAEERHTVLGSAGKLKLLAFVNRGDMADYTAAIRAAAATGGIPAVASVRGYASRPGVALNLEQQLSPDLGFFARASVNDGHKEEYEFTDVDRSLSAGLSWKGSDWGRPDDAVGLAAVANGISKDAENYFANGGLGILVGDGILKHYGIEKIAESYYSFVVIDQVSVSADYQLVTNPAYNRDRGPVSVFGFRLHAQM